MAALFHLWVPTTARIRRDELALTLWDQRQLPMRAGPRPMRLLHQRSGQYPWCEGGHHHRSWSAARDDDAGQTTRRPHHRAAPTSITGTASLTLDFTVVHSVSRRGTEYTCDENALLKANRAKVTKHHEWLHANTYCSPPRDTAPPLRLRAPQDGRRRAARRRELPEVAPDTTTTLPAPRRNVLSTPVGAQLYSLRASATRLTGKHWAAPYASSLLARSRARARCGVGGFAPAPTAHVLASR